MKLFELVHTIQSVNKQLQNSVVSAINQGLTIRNWLIGYYIVEFEQNGAERAAYGKGLMNVLAKELNSKGFSSSDLSRYRQFYLVYPNIFATVSQSFKETLSEHQIFATLSQKNINNIDETSLVTKMSFSHFRELIKIDDPLKRRFYEAETIKSTWSVRELQRQINSLYFERSGLSSNKKALQALTVENDNKDSVLSTVKDLYVFEFLDLPAKHVVTETDLETALLDNIQHFILEMGEGFCFEARQKRILIGDEYFFIDLVFYHRVLKCHILVELKVDKFTHHNSGQLNTYINYYNEKVKLKNDNQTIGILLVTDKNEALVEYATVGMDNKLFIKKYMVELPSEAEIRNELKKYIDSSKS